MAKQIRRIALPYPVSVNRLYIRTRYGMALSDEAKAYKQEAGYTLNTLHLTPLVGDVVLSITAYRPEQRGDLDNILKILLDVMQKHVYKNDDQIVELHVYRMYDKVNPRVEVEWSSAIVITQ